jgi:DNA-binding winged helix-turn-helix (wHTH) protein
MASGGNSSDQGPASVADDANARIRRSPFRLGTALVEPRRNRIVSTDAELLIEPKVMDVLCVLAGAPGEVLSREHIIDLVWGRSFGADESLTRAVSLLRKALSTREQDVIETVPRRGYRLTANVADQMPAAPAAISPRRLWRVGFAAVAAAVVAVSVLIWWQARSVAKPLQGVPVEIDIQAGDPAASRFGVALGDALARAPILRVSAKALEGRDGYAVVVGPVDGHGRISVRLIDRADSTVLWSVSANAAGGAAKPDAVRIDAVAGQLVNRVLTGAKRKLRTQDLESLRPWQLVLLATWVPGDDEVFTRPHGPDAFYLQRRALALDPRYAPAHASLASALAYRALFTSGGNVAALRRQAATHAEQAQAIAPYDAGVLYELATFHRMMGDRGAASATLDRVLALQPDHPLASADRIFIGALCTPSAGNGASRLRALLDARTLDDPVRWVLLSHLADLELGAGDWASAVRDAATSRQIVRQTWSGITLAAALAVLDRPAEAKVVARETKLEWPRLAWSDLAGDAGRTWCLGGNATSAQQAFKRLGDVESR